MHQKRLQPTASFSQNSHKIRLRHEKCVDPESASEILLKPVLVQQGKTAEPTRIPVAQFRLTGTVEQQPHVNVLRGFRLRGLKQKEAGHPKLSHHIATGLIICKSQDDTLAASLDGFQAGTSIPRHGGVAFSNDILTSDPHIGHLCPNEARTDLSSGDFCFWKLRHNLFRLRPSEGAPLRHEDGRKARSATRRIMRRTAR